MRKKTKEDGPSPAEQPEDMKASDTTSMDDRMEESNELGSVQIHNNVIATIARLAALKVAGVAELSGTFVDGLAGMIGKKPVDRGIHVEVIDNSVVLELHVVLDFGVRIPQVAWQIQNEVRQAVEQMTGKTVKAINITVQTLRFPNEATSAVEEGSNS